MTNDESTISIEIAQLASKYAVAGIVNAGRPSLLMEQLDADPDATAIVDTLISNDSVWESLAGSLRGRLAASPVPRHHSLEEDLQLAVIIWALASAKFLQTLEILRDEMAKGQAPSYFSGMIIVQLLRTMLGKTLVQRGEFRNWEFSAEELDNWRDLANSERGTGAVTQISKG